MRCFLFGHSDATEAILVPLQAEILRHIFDCGVTEFIVGRYGHFDYLARQAVYCIRQSFPHIRLTLLLPYYPPRLPMPPEFDGTIYPAGLESTPPRLRILRANRAMIASCDYAIACVTTPASASGKLLAHAQLRQRQGRIHITNIAPA